MKLKRVLMVLLACVISFSALTALGGCGDKKETYTITFDAKGGELTQTTKKVEFFKPVGKLPIPTKENYEFNEWVLIKEGYPDEVYTENTVYTLRNDITLVATYNKLVTINFDLDGGSYNGQNSIAPIKVAENEQIGDLPSPTLAGKIFSHWQLELGTELEPNNVAIFSDTVYNFGIDSIVIKAIFVDEESYTITYNLDGGEMGNRKVTYKASDDTFELPQPTKEGFTFMGWTSTELAISVPNKTVSIMTGTQGDLNFVANWEENYRVTLKLEGEVDGVKVSAIYTKPKSFEAPYGSAMKNYIFFITDDKITAGYMLYGWRLELADGTTKSVKVDKESFTETVLGEERNVIIAAVFVSQDDGYTDIV